MTAKCHFFTVNFIFITFLFIPKDFYSHSNWVELGKKFPNSNLIRSDTSIGNIAGKKKDDISSLSFGQ